jgi:hypothetical protein
MEWLESYFLHKDIISDITWIGIGSACIRDSKPENMQQFPPWLSSEFIKPESGITCTLINIDPIFESPYLLTKIYPQLVKTWTSPDGLVHVFSMDKLECIYVNVNLDYYNAVDGQYEIIEDVIRPFDTINRLVMSQSKLLVSGIFTGISNNIIEKYFTDLYKSEYRFSTSIIYNFMNDSNGSCVVNLLENYPLIDWDSNQIIKINQMMQTIGPEIITEIKTIFNPKILGIDFKLKSIALNLLKNLTNLEIFLYRNYLNKNFQDHMKWIHYSSKFSDIDLKCFDSLVYKPNINLMQKLIYQTYSPYIQLLRSLEFDPGILHLLDQTLQSIPSDPKEIYEWTNKYTKFVK